ncbi:MAG TPA: gamma-glutamyltransferase [Microlunatus sp.]
MNGAVGPTGLIATPDARATAVGQAVLDRGGSAVDAVIAASAVLCVVYPQNVSIGGDTWTLIQPADGTPPRAVNGTGRAAAALSAAVLRDAGLTEMPGSGPHSITVPGLVSAWGDLHASWGRLPFPELITPARDLAANGFAVAPALARDLARSADLLRTDPGCAATFFHDDGSAYRVGERLQLPALSDSLTAIAADGPEALYEGELGGRYIQGLRRAGSLLTVADLARHRTERFDPISAHYRGLEVLTAPPNSQGFTLLKILSLMAELGLDDPADPRQAGCVLAVVTLAAEERNARLADPDAVAVEVGLAAELITAQAQRLRSHRSAGARSGASPRPPLGGDTIGMVAVDAHGCWVSSVQSVAGSFGSRLLEPSTGILAHNRGSGFSLDPIHPAFLGPGRRPPHTLMPCLVRQDGDTVGSLAAMGGHSQPFILAQVLSRVLAGDPPQDAVAAPRWVVPRTDPSKRQVLVDERLDPAVAKELSSATTESIPFDDNRLGHCQALWHGPAGTRVGTDPRADGLADPVGS